MDFIRGKWVLCAEGTFCERIINITKEMGIFIQDIKQSGDKTLLFTVSFKGAMKLFSSPLPEDITLSVKSRKGLPAILENNKKRYALFLCPVFIVLLIFLSTNIIWHVNIIDADAETEQFLLTELEKLGVKKGAITFLIDQGDVKNQMLIKHEKLQWIWVDIKGGTALVKFSMRTMPPEVFDEDAFYNVCATHDATITRVLATKGESLVKEGDNVLKGQILIEGIMPKDAEEKKLIHASGKVFGIAEFEKTVTVPSKTQIRTPTGQKSEHLSINFLNFNIKLFINSRILYREYDIIEYNRHIGFLPVSFNKKVVQEVDVSYKDNDISLMAQGVEADFRKELESEDKKITYIETFTSRNGDEYIITSRALCEFDIAEERRINLGENYPVTDN